MYFVGAAVYPLPRGSKKISSPVRPARIYGAAADSVRKKDSKKEQSIQPNA